MRQLLHHYWPEMWKNYIAVIQIRDMTITSTLCNLNQLKLRTILQAEELLRPEKEDTAFHVRMKLKLSGLE